MKIVVKIGGSALDDQSILDTLGCAVYELVSDAHRIAIIHGSRGLDSWGSSLNGSNHAYTKYGYSETVPLLMAVGHFNKALVAELGLRRVQALGLWGSDASLILVRKTGD